MSIVLNNYNFNRLSDDLLKNIASFVPHTMAIISRRGKLASEGAFLITNYFRNSFTSLEVVKELGDLEGRVDPRFCSIAKFELDRIVQALYKRTIMITGGAEKLQSLNAYGIISPSQFVEILEWTIREENRNLLSICSNQNAPEWSKVKAEVEKSFITAQSMVGSAQFKLTASLANRVRDYFNNAEWCNSIPNLCLYDTKITSIPPEIFRLTKIKSILLCRNLITTIPEDILKLTHLVSLHLGGNPLKTVPTFLDKLPSLKHIYLNKDLGEGAPINILDKIRLFGV